jgi:enterochelin esterase family protein
MFERMRLLNLIASLVLASAAANAEKMPVPQLIQLAKKKPDSDQFRSALAETAGPEALKKGPVVLSHGPDFLLAFETPGKASLEINDAPARVRQSKGSNHWFHVAKLETGRSHAIQWSVDGKPAGPRVDAPAYLPEAYAVAGVPQGKVSEKMAGESKIYPGMKYDWWIYVPAQYDGSAPAAVMIWQDGEKHVNREGPTRLLNAVDNLIHQKRIPVMIQVLISPGTVEGRRWRSIQYDTVSDTYARYLLEEVLPEVAKKYRIRTDGYSRAIAGESSGAVCAFTAAWFKPDQFSRVYSRIGTYTSIQWKPGQLDGGNIYPFWIRKSDRKNIRVWLQDGSEDLENNHGSWPLQNIHMANSLKMMDYDFRFRWGNGQHNTAHGSAETPEALTWLWRGYDPAKTGETYAGDPAEKDKPYWRVRALNRQ